MGIASYRIKIGLYVFVIIMVGTLFGLRVHNAWQRTNYITKTIFENGDIQISLHHPAKILSAKNDASYPLTLSSYYTGDINSPHTYEIFLQSSTLLFVDARGVEITPHFQFTGDRTFFEQNVYIRPFLSEIYPQHHEINSQIVENGQIAPDQLTSIEIQAEPMWLSFFSLAAVSLVEISVATALITWIVNAIDASLTARKERVAKIREALNGLSSLSYLEQMDKLCKLEDEVKNEYLDDDIGDEIKRDKGRFTEEEFLRVLGDRFQKNEPIDFLSIQKLHNRFHPSSNHKGNMEILGKILDQESFIQEDALQFISTTMRIWDDFDADSKDLIVGVLKRLSQKVDFSYIPATKLLTQVFVNNNRRRLLRDKEIKALFPRLVSSPVGYDADWLHSPDYLANPRVINWLKQHNIVANPFGAADFKNFPFYPEYFARPDCWEDFLISVPQRAQCPTQEDAKVLAFLLRSECMPTKNTDDGGNEIVVPGRQVFPVWVSLEQTTPSELPLVTLARSVARAWLDFLTFSPDALLDLAPVDQIKLFELLCWVFGSNNAVINFLKQTNLKGDYASARLLIKKIGEFKSEISLTSLLQDSILISWLKIRPPDLNYTYLILPLDEFPFAVRNQWLDKFNPLISTLSLNEVITKTSSFADVIDTLLLPAIRLEWSGAQLKTSLNAQFDAALDKEAMRVGRSVYFHEMFGPGVADEETTQKLISAAHHSLARMCILGNRLFQHHCENRIENGVPEKYLYVEDLETILKPA